MAKLIVIGAGIAGLSAAITLAKQNHEVSILEARNRLGGRIYTYTVDGINLEIGASFWEGKNNNPFFLKYFDNTSKSTQQPWVKRLNHQHCLMLNAPTLSSDEIALYYQEANALLNQCYQKRQGQNGEQLLNDIRTIGSAEKQYWVTQFFQHHFQHFNTPLAKRGLPSFKMPIPNLLESWDEDNADFTVVLNGYDNLIKQLANECLAHGVNIKLNTPITSIIQNNPGIMLKSNTQSFFADKVISTIPIGVLKKASNLFKPALSAQKQAALDAVGVHQGVRISLLFKEKPFWNPVDAPFLFIDNPNKPLREFRNGFPIYGKTILQTDKYSDICQRYFDAYPDNIEKAHAAIIDYVMMDLKKAFAPKIIPQPAHTFIYNWASDTYAQGTYPYRTTLLDEKRQLALEKNEGNLYFAGADFSRLGFSVHHGYANGQQVANLVLDDLKKDAMNTKVTLQEM